MKQTSVTKMTDDIEKMNVEMFHVIWERWIQILRNDYEKHTNWTRNENRSLLSF